MRCCQHSTTRDLSHPARAPATHSNPLLSSRPHRATDAGAGARAYIRQQVAQHAQHNEGILVLAHPPGAGKGYNTVEGLKGYLRSDPDPGFIIWTSLADDHGNLYPPYSEAEELASGALDALSAGMR